MAAPSPKEIRLSAQVALGVLDLLDRETDLLLDDKLFLCVQALERVAEDRLLREGTVPTKRFGRCTVVAADAVVRALNLSPDRWLLHTKELLRGFAVFTQELKDLHRRAQTPKGAKKLSARERKVLELWQFFRQEVGPRRSSAQFQDAAKKALFALGQPNGPEDRTQALELGRSFFHQQPDGMFIGHDGRMRLSHRRMRDSLEKNLGLRRLDRGGAGGLSQAPLRDDPADTDELQVLEAVDAILAVDRLREFVRGRLPKAEDGSPRRCVLEHFEPLMLEGLSIDRLAKESGKPKTGLQRAFSEERAAFIASFRAA